MFTFPRKAAKCSGAAQKIMYLAYDYWRKVLRIRKLLILISKLFVCYSFMPS